MYAKVTVSLLDSKFCRCKWLHDRSFCIYIRQQTCSVAWSWV